MKPSTGVTAIAVVAILEGSLACLFGLLFFLGLAMTSVAPQREGTSDMDTIAWMVMGVQGLVYLAAGGWMVASGIGLLRLKNWARISVIVLGGLIAVFSLFGLLGTVMMSYLPIPTPQGEGIPPGFMTAMFWVMGAISAVQMSIGIWWVVLLNRSAVTRQFQPGAAGESVAEGAPAKEPGRPISISVIAWLMVGTGAVSLPYYLLDIYPALVFGAVIEGWPAAVIYNVLTLAHIAVGIGLLRLKPRGIDLAIGLFVFNLVNVVVTMAVPDSFRQFLAIMMNKFKETEALPWTQAAWEQLYWFGYAFSVLWLGVVLWFLLRRRTAYLAAAQRKLNPPAAAGVQV